MTQFIDILLISHQYSTNILLMFYYDFIMAKFIDILLIFYYGFIILLLFYKHFITAKFTNILLTFYYDKVY